MTTEGLTVVPVTRDRAMDFIVRVHRHHGRPPGYRFAVGVALDGILVGVACGARPVSRVLDDGISLEVTRVATDGTPNACSMLYGTCWRAAKALGYVRAFTYTQEGESGASLRAAGWRVDNVRPARDDWSTPTRQRVGGTGGIARMRWIIGQPREVKAEALVAIA